MSDLPNSYEKQLYTAARMYTEMGWSVIPVMGAGASNPKAAAIKWEAYQRRRPSAAELKRWFVELGFAGLAIVCGRLSGLIVIDIDDPVIAALFEHRFPQLTQTRVIRSATRGLPHYYFRLPPELPTVETIRQPGIELRSNGAYVVAPPTRIESGEWRIERGGLPRTLTTRDLNELREFFISVNQPDESDRKLVLLSHNSPSPTDSSLAADFHRRANIDLTAYYRNRAPHIGRNNALFAAAIHARDNGLSEPDALAALASAHAEQAASWAHRPEAPAQRQREAVATIRSAYSRPPHREVSTAAQGNGLPDSIREKLLQQGQASAARVLDALYLAGWKDHRFTEREAFAVCQQSGIGRRALLDALKLTDAYGQPVFCENLPPPAPPQQKRPPIAEHSAHSSTNSNTFSSGEEKNMLCTVAARIKNRGRPPRYYALPDIPTLCKRMKVQRSISAPLQTAELRSAKHYRQALHRELIRRRPGQYARGWLSARLGVSRWTTLRYDDEIGICVQPMYSKRPISWANIADVPETPDDAPAAGAWLQTFTGKRYPPIRDLAKKLLAQRGNWLLYIARVANHYSFNSG